MSAPTVHLRPTNHRLAVFQTRFHDGDLDDTLAERAFGPITKGAHPQAVLDRAVRAWKHRAADELRSLVCFTAFAHDLARCRVPVDVLSAAARLVRDEARHVELCRRMVVRLGGDEELSGEPEWVSFPFWMTRRRRVLHTIIGSLCIGETLSVHTLAAVRKNTTDPLTRAVVTQLVADEAIHSRFGWVLLEWWLEDCRPRERKLARRLAARYLERTIASMRPHASSARTHPAGPFGSLAPVARRAAFDVATRDILKRFAALDLTPDAQGVRT